MKRISILGVLVGGIVDVVSTNILVIPFVVYVMIVRVDFLAMPTADVSKAVTHEIQADWLLFGTQLMIGSFCSVIGGFVAALIARHDELLNGALSAYLCVALGVYSLMRGAMVASVFLAILGFVLSPALGLLGGTFGCCRSRRRKQSLAKWLPLETSSRMQNLFS